MLLLLVVPVLAKLVLIVVLARLFGAPLATSLRVGFYLAQAGELALVMLALAVQNDILPAGPAAAGAGRDDHLDVLGAARHPVRRSRSCAS